MFGSAPKASLPAEWTAMAGPANRYQKRRRHKQEQAAWLRHWPKCAAIPIFYEADDLLIRWEAIRAQGCVIEIEIAITHQKLAAARYGIKQVTPCRHTVVEDSDHLTDAIDERRIGPGIVEQRGYVTIWSYHGPGSDDEAQVDFCAEIILNSGSHPSTADDTFSI